MSKKVPGIPFNSKTASEAGKKSKRGKSIAGIIREIMETPVKEIDDIIDGERPIPEKWRGRTVQDIIWLRAASDALDGDKDARRDIADRLEGKAMQHTEISGPDGGPLESSTNIIINPIGAKDGRREEETNEKKDD